MEDKKPRPWLISFLFWLGNGTGLIIGLMDTIQDRTKIVWKGVFKTVNDSYQKYIIVHINRLRQDLIDFVQKELQWDISWIPDWLPDYIPIACIFFIGFTYSYFYLKRITVFHFLYDAIKEWIAALKEDFLNGIWMLVVSLVLLFAFLLVSPVFFIAVPALFVGLVAAAVYLYYLIAKAILIYAILAFILIIVVWYFINKSHLKLTAYKTGQNISAFFRNTKAKAPVAMGVFFRGFKLELLDKNSSFSVEMRFWIQLIKLQYKMAFAIGLIILAIIVVNNRVEFH